MGLKPDWTCRTLTNCGCWRASPPERLLAQLCSELDQGAIPVEPRRVAAGLCAARRVRSFVVATPASGRSRFDVVLQPAGMIQPWRWFCCVPRYPTPVDVRTPRQGKAPACPAPLPSWCPCQWNSVPPGQGVAQLENPGQGRGPPPPPLGGFFGFWLHPLRVRRSCHGEPFPRA